MTLAELLLATLIATAGAVATTAVGAYASRRWRLPGLAQRVDAEEDKLVNRLTARLELAEEDSKKAIERADQAQASANESERRRAGCEEEILRLKSDVRALEGELLDLHRKTGSPAPRALITRHREHQREDEDT